jgi:hypothetical protein
VMADWSSVPDATGDDRPYGWGTCSICQEDCEESDYNPRTRVSTHRACAARAFDAIGREAWRVLDATVGRRFQ